MLEVLRYINSLARMQRNNGRSFTCLPTLSLILGPRWCCYSLQKMDPRFTPTICLLLCRNFVCISTLELLGDPIPGQNSKILWIVNDSHSNFEEAVWSLPCMSSQNMAKLDPQSKFSKMATAQHGHWAGKTPVTLSDSDRANLYGQYFFIKFSKTLMWKPLVLPIDIENPYRLSNCLYR